MNTTNTQDPIRLALEHISASIGKQLELIRERAPGNFLDKRPVVQALMSHKRRADAALQSAAAQTQGDAREAFEALYCRLFPFASSMYGKFNREGDDYDDANVLVGWRIFQAMQAASTQASEPSAYTIDQIADACVAAEINDSKFESLSIALQDAAPALAVEPLTYEKVVEAAQEAWADDIDDFVAGVRFAERAHGIPATTPTQAAQENKS